MLVQFLQTNRGLAFNRMFAMMDYPRDIMPLYAQGHSVSRYLIEQGGKRKYVNFVSEGLKTRDWPGAVRNHYAVRDLSVLQTTWLEWVKEGSPPLKREAGPETQLASAAGQRRPRPSAQIYRGQSAASQKHRHTVYIYQNGEGRLETTRGHFHSIREEKNANGERVYRVGPPQLV